MLDALAVNSRHAVLVYQIVGCYLARQRHADSETGARGAVEQGQLVRSELKDGEVKSASSSVPFLSFNHTPAAVPFSLVSATSSRSRFWYFTRLDRTLALKTLQSRLSVDF